MSIYGGKGQPDSECPQNQLISPIMLEDLYITFY